MLVLSRGVHDKVLFPELGISVEILRVRGDQVRVGIEAPPEFRVLRHELAEMPPEEPGTEGSGASPRGQSRRSLHEWRNRLHTAALAMSLAQKQFELGHADQGNSSLQQALREFDRLDDELAQQLADDESESDEPRRPRALIVEDNANESELLAAYLRLCGFEVDRAENGYQAVIFLARHQPPDVVLLDMRMPRMDGVRTIRTIRSNPIYGHVKVFAVSGTDPAELGVPRGPDGVDAWFPKPVNPRQLVEAITRTIQDARSVQDARSREESEEADEAQRRWQPTIRPVA